MATMGETLMRQYEYNNLEILIGKVGVAKVIASIAKICFQKSLTPSLNSDAWNNAHSYLVYVTNSRVVKTVSLDRFAERVTRT